MRQKRPKKRKIVFLEVEYGEFSPEQEVFCWRAALHGNLSRAFREAYASITNDSSHVQQLSKILKIRRRVFELKQMHVRGEVDLLAGPWIHYAPRLNEVGNPHPPKNRPLRMCHILTGRFPDG